LKKEKTMKEFMFLYKGGDPAWQQASAEEKQAVMAKWAAWMGALGEKDQLVNGGSPLDFTGKKLTKDGVVTDISASEFKELVSGYTVIKAKSYDDAIAIAKECPILHQPNAKIEIRAVTPM
jgi:hypothetical protein